MTTTDTILSYTNPHSRRAKKRRSRAYPKIKAFRSKNTFFQAYKRHTYSLHEWNQCPNPLMKFPREEFKHKNERCMNARYFAVPVIINETDDGYAPVATHLRPCIEKGFEGYVELEWIEAFPKGQGLGGLAMNALCHLADLHMQPLILTAYPLGKDKSDEALLSLMKFYVKFGFEPVIDNTMRRLPPQS